MVDFNNETTIGTPAVDVERITVLQKRQDFLEALEGFKKQQCLGGGGISSATIRARLMSLFLVLQATFKRRFKKEVYEEFKKDVFEKKESDEIIKLFITISEELDDMRLTRIDTQKVYDKTDVEAENKIKGF